MKLTTLLTSTILLLCVSTQLLAYESGDLILRVGPAKVDPDDSSGLINLGDTSIPNTSVQVGDDTQLGITVSYMLNANWGIGLLASTPFEHEITETGVGVGKVGSAKHLPPTLTAQYFPMAAESNFQPYVGIGVNYTTFFSEETAGELDAALGEGDMSLDDSFGFAAQLGADYAINDRWSLNAALWWIDLDTDATINTPAGQVKVDVEIDPLVYMIGIGYTF